MADNPFAGVRDFVSEVNRMRNFGVRGIDPYPDVLQRTHASAWVPTTDIVAVGGDLVIQMELPGVDPDAVDLRFAQGVLTVSGSRDPIRTDDSAFYVRERLYGEFRRTIQLPDGVEPEAIDAEFVNGLVIITVSGGARQTAGTAISVVNRSAGPRRRGLQRD